MKAVRRLLWWLIASSTGGLNRARIIHALNEHPCNANQLSEKLNLDYKTVRHHIKILENNNLIISTVDKYGKMYFLSPLLEESYEVFREIWAEIGEIGKKKIKKGKDGDVIL
jgi:DNA-binding transcriptional ArsR family regulator